MDISDLASYMNHLVESPLDHTLSIDTQVPAGAVSRALTVFLLRLNSSTNGSE